MWIPITEKLPEWADTGYSQESLRILICDFNDLVPYVSIAIMRRYDQDDSTITWHSSCGEGWKLDAPTHWMPLPIHVNKRFYE